MIQTVPDIPPDDLATAAGGRLRRQLDRLADAGHRHPGVGRDRFTRASAEYRAAVVAVQNSHPGPTPPLWFERGRPAAERQDAWRAANPLPAVDAGRD